MFDSVWIAPTNMIWRVGARMTLGCMYAGHRFADGLTMSDHECIAADNGTWAPHLEGDCADSRCPPVPDALHSFPIRHNETSIGARVPYECELGYKPVPGAIMNKTCNEQLAWEGLADCEIVTCPQLWDLLHINPWSRNVTYGVETWVACEPGYEMNVSFVLVTCLADGTWSAPFANDTCSAVSCGEPHAVAFSTATGSGSGAGTYFQDVITYTCIAGYTFNHTRTMSSKCGSTRAWYPRVPNCKLMQCDPIGAWFGYLPNVTVYTYGTTINYSCLQPYQDLASGNSYEITFCAASGSWDPPLQECIGEPPVDPLAIPVEEASDAIAVGLTASIILGILAAIIVILDILTYTKEWQLFLYNTEEIRKRLCPPPEEAEYEELFRFTDHVRVAVVPRTEFEYPPIEQKPAILYKYRYAVPPEVST